MKLVHSFYSKPYLQTNSISWAENRSIFESQALSLFQAMKHGFKNTELVTDDFGKYLLIDILKLPYKSVKTDIQEIYDKYNTKLWVVGKMKAYQIQEEPFLHIDNDFYLFDNIDENLLKSDILFQNKEFFDIQYKKGHAHCYPAFIHNIKSKAGYIPDFLYNICENKQVACNLGFYAVNNIGINKIYLEEAFKFIDSDLNRFLFDETHNNVSLYNTSIEQFFLMLICKKYNVETAELIPNCNYKKDLDWGNKYVHMLASEKQKLKNCNRISKILYKINPGIKTNIDNTVAEYEKIKLNF